MEALPAAQAAAGNLAEAEADVARLSVHVDDVYLDYLRRHGVQAP